MDAQDAAPQEPIDTDAVPVVITAAGLGLDGEHGPLFSDIDLELTAGFHAIRMPGGPEQHTLLLTLAGRLKPTHGTVTVLGDTQPRDIRRHCSIAAFADIDELEEMVTVQTVLAEQRRWLASWYSRVPNEAGEAQLAQVFGEIPPLSPRIIRSGTVSAADHSGAVFGSTDPGGRRSRAGPGQRPAGGRSRAARCDRGAAHRRCRGHARN